MKDLPPIAPTGSMTPEEYVSYMMQYNSEASDIVSDNLAEFHTMDTVDSWEAKWVCVLGEVDTRISRIESDIEDISRQILLLRNSLK